MNGLQSELLKYKRTFMGKFIVFIPVFFAVYALVMQVMMRDNALAKASGNTSMSWSMLLVLVFNWWSFLFLPLGMALFAGMAASQEKKSGNYRALYAHHISPYRLWVQKIMGMAVYALFSTFVFIVVVIGTGLCTARGAMPLRSILVGSMVCWLVSLALIPIQLWIATWGGMLGSMGVGFVGMIAGVLIAPTAFWIAAPWSWATRLMCPVIGVHPNGVVLNPTDPLLDSSVIPLGIMVSIIVLLILTALTGAWFQRREIK